VSGQKIIDGLKEAVKVAPAFERATELVARKLASFRLGLDCDDPFAYTENERLMAGHIVGNLWSNDLLNTGNEKWTPVESETPLAHAGQYREK